MTTLYKIVKRATELGLSYGVYVSSEHYEKDKRAGLYDKLKNSTTDKRKSKP